MSTESSGLLSWTHYRVLIQVEDSEARAWYEKEAFEQTWSVRTLQRNVSSQYYYRMLKSQNKELVKQEMLAVTEDLQTDKLEFVHNPVIAEFLGMQNESNYTESDLETCIIDNLQKIPYGTGKGICICCKAAAYTYGKRGLLY